MAQDLTESAQDSVAVAPRRRGHEPAAPEADLYAALDLGTNSCRMLIATPDRGHFRVVDAFAKSVRLGSGLERTGHLSRGAIGRTLAALEICAEKLERYRVRNVRLVATEACRRARNGNHFLALAARQTGLRLEVIRPEEEARLAVISCAPLVAPEASQVLVFDIGGGSTELVWLDLSAIPPARAGAGDREPRDGRRAGAAGAARIVDFISVPLGVATLHERYADVADDSARFALMSWYFEEQIAGFKPYIESLVDDAERFQMIGTSGTVTTVGRGASRAQALRPAQGRRHAAVGAGDRRGDRPLPAARAGRAAHRHRPRPRPVGADHVGRGDPADAAQALADRTRCGWPTAGCARACSLR